MTRRPKARARPKAKPGALAKYEATYAASRRALAAAKNVPEVKDVLSIAAAMGAYAKKAADRSMEADAFEQRLRAERRLGQMMAAQKRTVGFAKGGGDKRSKHRVSKKPGGPPTLEDAGIDKNLAHRARNMAWLSDDGFEDHVRRCREGRYYSADDSQRIFEHHRDTYSLNDPEIRTFSEHVYFHVLAAQQEYEEAVRAHEGATAAEGARREAQERRGGWAGETPTAPYGHRQDKERIRRGVPPVP